MQGGSAHKSASPPGDGPLSLRSKLEARAGVEPAADLSTAKDLLLDQTIP